MNLLHILTQKFSALITWFLHRPLLQKIIILGVILVAIWFIVAKFFSGSKTPQYQTSQVQSGTIISTISESGNVSAGGETDVTSPTDGIVEEIYVKNGDQVTVGQNLFKVKSTATPQQQASALSSYLSAQNNLNSAKSKMNSLQAALFTANQAFINDKGINNPTDTDKTDPKYIEENANWLQAQADYTNQQNVINQAQANLTSASLSYAATQDSVVTAPVPGTVANLSATIGTGVTASSTTTTTSNNSTSTSSSSGGSTVLVIGDFSKLQVKVQISEVDLPSVHTGQKATVTLDAFPSETFVGNVDSVDTIGTSTSGVVTYNAYITLIAPPSEIKPGMTATSIIQTTKHDNVLSVPSSAVQTVSGQSYVRVLKNGAISQIPVTTGISSDTNTEIDSGLTSGETVVTSVITSTTSTSSNSTTSPFSGLTGGRGFGGGGGGAVIRTGGGGR